MPAPRPPEFRRRAVELARLRDKPIAQIAKDLQISESCLRRWMDQADVDDGHKQGLSSDDRKELVERLMRCHGLAGVHRRRWRHAKRTEAIWPDRVARKFVADAPDRLWVTDITQHRTTEGWVYAAVVLDVFSRRVVGWSIADHLRT